eukprot:gnl/Chilomastix_caulleri/8977.p2 GENE.gnl/Chilomastix_caulleri/8977~~gnl/Chilomastix_caulleri/8977.p2  ORF type:complete len:61 (-),score=11.30 gnl/Chilomastix_caulleri/8977:47-229(-)
MRYEHIGASLFLELKIVFSFCSFINVLSPNVFQHLALSNNEGKVQHNTGEIKQCFVRRDV